MALSYTEYSSSLVDSSDGFFDGEYVWFAPAAEDFLHRVSADGIVSSFEVAQGPGYSINRVGDYVYIGPRGSTHQGLIKCDTRKGNDIVVAVGSWVSQPSAPNTLGLVTGDSGYLWSNSFSPLIGLIRWKLSDMTFTKYPHTKNHGPIIYANGYLWVMPNERAYVCKFNLSGSFVAEYAMSDWSSDFCRAAAYDGSKYIVAAPYSGDYILTFDVTDNSVATYALAATSTNSNFFDITYDGTDFWLAPWGYDKLVQFNAATGTRTYHTDCPGDSDWEGLYGIAYNTNNGKVMIGPDNYGKVVTFISPNYVPAPVAPTITTHPGPTQRVNIDDSVMFTVVASGTETLLYQWEKDTTPIDSATSASYTIDPVDEDDAAEYRCVVTNDEGDATSNVATLTVNEADPEPQVSEGGGWPLLRDISGWPKLG